MTIISFYPNEAAQDQPTKVAFYLPIDPANAGGDNNIKYYMTPFEHGDAETLLTFLHDFQELIWLKGVNDDIDQQVQIVRLLLRDEVLEKFKDPVITPVDATAAQNIQDATLQQNANNKWAALNGAIEGLLNQLLPLMAGKMIKEEMQTFQKPIDMSVEDFIQRMMKINRFIGLCPGPECQYDNAEMRSLIEQACPNLRLLDLQKQATYSTMTLVQVKSYFKLLKSAENHQWTRQTQQNQHGYLGQQGGNPCASGRGANGQSYRQRLHGGGTGNGRVNPGNSPMTPPCDQSGGGRGGCSCRVQATQAGSTGGCMSPHGMCWSEQRQGNYCPHCCTTEHDGSTCPLYQVYWVGCEQQNCAEMMEFQARWQQQRLWGWECWWI
jgi:hypothetical protein